MLTIVTGAACNENVQTSAGRVNTINCIKVSTETLSKHWQSEELTRL